MGKTKIEWTHRTWNPVSGCSKVSQGCAHCYAERMWPRLSAPGQPYEGRAFTDVQCHQERLADPLRWRKPWLVFVNSMSDLFHDDVAFQFIAGVFGIMAACPDHTFQVLTKRPRRMLEFFEWCEQRADTGRSLFPNDSRAWRTWQMLHVEARRYASVPPHHGGLWPLPNVWIGVSIEDQATADERIPLLLQTPAVVRFASAEPLLGPINLDFALDPFSCTICGHAGGGQERGEGDYECPACGANEYKPDGGHLRQASGTGRHGIDWVIAGGESGPKARATHPNWVYNLRDQCADVGVQFFFKQWGEWAPISEFPIDDAFELVDGRYALHQWDHDTSARCGRRIAGRELDGRTWDQMPEAQQTMDSIHDLEKKTGRHWYGHTKENQS